MFDDELCQLDIDQVDEAEYSAEAMTWITQQYSDDEVNWAGDILIAKAPDPADSERALEVVSNWRSCHSFPLNTLKMNLRGKAGSIDSNSTVAQRIKRLPAIVHKLDRLRRLKLSELQDIGGCRAVVSDIKHVRSLRDICTKTQRRHVLLTQNDYLAEPKKSGYRSIHLVFEYHSDRTHDYDGRKIEMQIRSRLQHAWATTVETVQMFSQQHLKSSRGDKRWLRFFALMGSAMAHREHAAMVPETPTDMKPLLNELSGLAKELEVDKKLQAWTRALQFAQPDKGSHFLLSLDTSAERLTIRPYKESDLVQANADYLKLEKDNVGKPGMDAVLVSVESVKSLKTAYPNYFADTSLFLEALKIATVGKH